MGRRFPSSSLPSYAPTSLALTLPFAVASVAAVFAIVAALCASRRRKASSPKSPPPQPQPSPLRPTKTEDANADADVTAPTAAPPLPPASLPLPLPPMAVAAQAERASPANATLTSSTSGLLAGKPARSRRKLSGSLSMRIPEGLARIRTGRKQEVQQKAAPGGNVDEGNIWRKTIIMGERCRAPTDEDDEAAPVYNEKGDRQKNYRPRTPRSLPVSRTNSFTDSSLNPS